MFLEGCGTFQSPLFVGSRYKDPDPVECNPEDMDELRPDCLLYTSDAADE